MLAAKPVDKLERASERGGDDGKLASVAEHQGGGAMALAVS
jgi:hypothetical protein